MPEEQPRASEKFRVFLDGEEILWAKIIIAAGPDGMLCTLGGKVVKILEMVHNPSGEIDELYLAEVED